VSLAPISCRQGRGPSMWTLAVQAPTASCSTRPPWPLWKWYVPLSLLFICPADTAVCSICLRSGPRELYMSSESDGATPEQNGLQHCVDPWKSPALTSHQTWVTKVLQPGALVTGCCDHRALFDGACFSHDMIAPKLCGGCVIMFSSMQSAQGAYPVNASAPFGASNCEPRFPAYLNDLR